jgi:exonuclease SbcD
MAFKFLHTSDLHFGAARRLTPGSLDYLKRHEETLDRLLKVAVKERVDFILVSGDLFESASTTIPELIAAFEFFTKAGEIAPTVVTAGNHDELMVGEFQTQWLKMLNIPNVEFVSKPQVITLGHKGGPSHIAAIPWTGIKNQEQFDQLLYDVNLGVGEVEIMMLHECFAGVTLDSGLVSKGGITIPNIPSIRYFACGDIHKMQRLQVRGRAIGGGAYYSGAPMQYNFGDLLPKGCMVVEVSDDRIYTPTFVEIPQAIELHNITSLDQIPAESPHWYKLRIDAANMPRHVPANVKVTEPIPRKVDLPQPVLEDGKEAIEGYQNVDFSEGVADLLSSNGFSPEEIASSIQEVKQQAASV